jgi:HTH-type transcriptional regulator / antitoxin HipB
MSDLKKYIKNRKARDDEFAENYDIGYEDFKIGVKIYQLRKESGFSQEHLADLLHTKKSAISRLERHGEDIQLSTLIKIAAALGKKVDIVFKDAI